MANLREARGFSDPSFTISRRDLLKVGLGAGLAIGLNAAEKREAATAEQKPEWAKLPDYMAGFNFILYGWEGLEIDSKGKLKKEEENFLRMEGGRVLDRIVDANANSVSFVVPIAQDSWTASSVYRDPIKTPPDHMVQIMLEEAKKRGMTTALRILLDEHPNITSDPDPRVDFKWRGNLQPDNPDAWKESYIDIINEYADFAQENKVSLFTVGVELNWTEPDTTFWRRVTKEVEKRYDGNITYATNWDTYRYGVFNPAMYEGMNLVGYDAFNKIPYGSGASVEDLRSYMQQDMGRDLVGIAESTGLPVFLSEVGTRSTPASYNAPYLWENYDDAPAYFDDQANFHAAACGFGNGAFVWAEGLDSLTADHSRGHNVLNKPAEQVITDCFDEVTE